MPLARIAFAAFPVLLSRSRSIATCTALGASLITACGGADLVLPSRETPIVIRVVNGDGQTGEVGEKLETPVEVEVTDAGGEPVRDAIVVFELTSAGDGAQISPSPTFTDADGRALAHFRLGDKVGLQTGAAHVIVDGATGASAAFSAHANPADNPNNRPPDADYNWHCEDLSCQFTNASSDSDGSVIRWDWRFGDGATSDQAEPLHVYASPGTYTVTLIVTDNDGATDESEAHVDVDADEDDDDD